MVYSEKSTDLMNLKKQKSRVSKKNIPKTPASVRKSCLKYGREDLNLSNGLLFTPLVKSFIDAERSITSPKFLNHEEANIEAEKLMLATFNGFTPQCFDDMSDNSESDFSDSPNFKSCQSKPKRSVMDNLQHYNLSFPIDVPKSTPIISPKGFSAVDSDLESSVILKCSTPKPKLSVGTKSCKKAAVLTENVKRSTRRKRPFRPLDELVRTCKDTHSASTSPVTSNSSQDSKILRLKYVDLTVTEDGYKVGVHPVSNEVVQFIKSNESFQKVVAKWPEMYPLDEDGHVMDPVWPPEVICKVLEGVKLFVDVRPKDLKHLFDYNTYVSTKCRKMGARLQKTLNKKVEFVLFCDGKNSSYVKAMQNGAKLLRWDWVYHSMLRARMQDIDEFLVPQDELRAYEDLDPDLYRYKIHSLKSMNNKLKRSVRKIYELGGVSRDDPILGKYLPTRPSYSLPTNAARSRRRKTKQRGCPKKLDFEDEAVDHTPDEEIEGSESKAGKKTAQAEQTKESTAIKGPLDKIFDRLKDRKTSQGNPQIESSITEVIVIDDDDDDDVDIGVDKQGCIVRTESEDNGPFEKSINVSSATETLTSLDLNVVAGPLSDGNVMEVSMPEVNTSPVRGNSILSKPIEELEVSLCSSTYSLFTPVSRHRKVQRNRDSPTVVFTSLSSKVGRQIENEVSRLGHYEMEDQVSHRTTHLVTSQNCRRTMNLLKAIMRGCWILSIDWVHKSYLAGFWLSEEDFELKSICPAVVPCRLERQAFGRTLGTYSSQIFENIGKVFINMKTEPKSSDLREILVLGGAEISYSPMCANLIIGGNELVCDSVPHVIDKWILDCITKNKLLPFTKYSVE